MPSEWSRLRLMADFGDALIESGARIEDIHRLTHGGSEAREILEGFTGVLRGTHRFNLALDFTVRVDRKVVPRFPIWTDMVMHPELQCTGPAEFDLQRDVEQWLHDDQETSVVSGYTIYERLKKDDTLADQLGLADLLAIQKMGNGVFRALFKGKAVFGWKNVVRSSNDYLPHVPCLYKFGNEVGLDWRRLDIHFNSNNPALRFRPPAQAGK